MIRQKTLRLWIGIVSSAGIICAAAVLFPRVERFIITLAEEHLIRRKVNFYDDWMQTLAAWARGSIAIILAVDFFTLTDRGARLFGTIRAEIKECLDHTDGKSLLKPFGILAAVYLLGYGSLIRADYLFADDVARAVEGYHGWNGWSRHLADLLSTFIHGDTNLADISPLPQILGILLAALGGVLLVRVLCGTITAGALMAAVPLGLSPYFLESLSYKFDAPYMALSVAAGIAPFLCAGAKRAFIFVSVLSLLVMCMSYQASSGVYILVTIMLLFRDWNSRSKTPAELVSFGAAAAGSFCFALVLFRYIFMVAGTTGHGTSTSLLALPRLLPGMVNNLGTYLSTVNQDFGLPWKAGAAAICVLFVIHAARESMQRGILRLLVPLLVVFVSCAMSYGAYLALEVPLFAPRALIGFGVFIAVIGIALVSFRRGTHPAGRGIPLLCIIALDWCFFTFAFSYGNALADQKRYNDFRVEMLLHDLSVLFPNRTSRDPAVRLKNDTGFGPFTENIARHYPVIKRIIPGSRYYHTYKYMTGYFHWDEGTSWAGNPDLPVVFDSYYHTIKSDGTYIVAVFKQ
ncbi:MAG: glucosyltransferase domain-containing protein [Treponema sp.]|jgi:hypothetical protein|nr:glucosyltransferase domain-containing protein [Treponema sp.]